MKRLHLPVFLSLLVILIPACGPPQTAPERTASQPTVAPTSKPAWQQDWENALAGAKKEGTVVVLTSFGGEGRDVIARAFKEKHGLDAEFIVGRTQEINAKVSLERRAGLYLEDIYLSGTPSNLEFRDLGFLDPLKPVLVLPETLDPRAWLGGDLRFVDKEGTVLAYQVEALAAMLVNTDLVKPDELKSYKDLLSPRWKGKIVVMDPTMGSAGTGFFYLLWVIMGPDFTRELGKQDLTITRDGRLQVEWLARGKYSISGTPSSDIRNQFLKAGAPIKVILPVEGTTSGSAKGGLSLLNKVPHPNAAKVFVNWLLTREGQTVMTQVSGQSSRRLDVSQEGLDPTTLIQPGVKYIEGFTEEAIRLKFELQTISKEAWNVK